MGLFVDAVVLNAIVSGIGKVNVILLLEGEFSYSLNFILVLDNKVPVKLVLFVKVFNPLIFCVKVFTLSTNVLST